MVVRVMCPVLMVVSTLLAPQSGSQKSALVTVVADAAAPVRDLKPQEFIVREDNAKREVVGATAADDPLSIVILLDTATPPMGAQYPTRDVRTAVSSFVKTVLAGSADAQIALMPVAGAAVTAVDFTSSGADLDKAIQRLYPDQQPMAVMLEALTDAGKKLAGRPAPRRAIVSIDFNPPEASTEQMMKLAIDSIHNAGATLWAISVRGTAPTVAIREEVLNKVTKANGGLRLSSVDATGLEALLKSVANSLISQYIVTFMRPGGANPKVTEFATTRGPKVLLTPFMR